MDSSHGPQQEPVDEFRMRQMLAYLPFFAVMVDRERRYLWVNRVAPTLSLDQVLGRCVDELVDSTFVPTVSATIERAFETGNVGYYETRADGEGDVATWYGTTVVPLPAGERGGERALLLSTDITKQRAAEQALQTSEHRFRRLTEASPDLVAIVDSDLRLRYLNRNPPSNTNTRLNDVLGKTLHELTRPESVELAASTVLRVLATGEPGQYETRGTFDDGFYVCRVIRLSRSNEPGDEAAQALITVTDVTAQKRAEAERAELEARLQQSQKLEALGQLAGGVAHDFNNLLLVIQNHLEFARAAVLEGQSPLSELDTIRVACDRAAEVTQGLLAVGRRQPRQPRVVDLCELARKTTHLLRRAIPESVSLSLDLLSEPAPVYADETQLEQVLMNLCLNSRDATANGGTIHVQVTRKSASTGERSFLLIVSDTGAGMDAATLARAFEPFFTTKAPGRGTGLGLSMVHSLIAQNGGRVDIESELGAGTVVTATLPEGLSRPLFAAAKAESQEAMREGSETVLVAEDEPLVRDIVARVLRRAGYRVLEAENGQEAVDAFRRQGEEIDLVLLDAVMPTLGGKDAYEQIIRLYPQARVLFSSGYSADTLPSAFLESHELGVLTKPYRPSALLAAIERALHGRARPALPAT